jgi:hypothetical protein
LELHFVEGAPASPIIAFRPVCLGFEPFQVSSGDGVNLGISSGGRRGGIEKTLCWRPSQRHISCGVFSIADGQFIDNEIFLTAGLWVGFAVVDLP